MLDTPNNFLSRNTLLLKNNHPHIWSALQNYGGTVTGQIFYTNKDDLPNIRVTNSKGKTISLHLESDPEAEVSQFLNLIPENSTGVVILYGMGLGYTPKAILDKRPQIRHLIIFEESYSIFEQAIRHLDHSKLLSDNRVILSIGETDNIAPVLAPAMRALKLENIHTLNHLPSMDYNPGFYQKVSQQVFDIANANNMEGNTLSVYGHSFMDNRFKHLSSIHNDYLLEKLQGVFAGKPAIIVAGGPSLDKNIHLLSQAKNKAVIIAVDTVLPALLANNISPDFVCSIDYKSFIYEKLASVAPQAKNISLICLSWVDTSVTKIFPSERIFWSFTAKPVEHWINSQLGGTILNSGAGSVAQLNFLAATLMGCSPIIFVGQDLAYTTSNSHMKHAVLTHSDDMDKILKSKELLWVKGVTEDKVPTIRSYVAFKKTFEQMIHATPNKYINATEGGAHIEGTEILSLEKTLNLFCLDSFEIEKLITDRLRKNGPIKIDKLLKEFRVALKQIELLNKTIQKADRLTQKAFTELTRLRKKRNKRISSQSELPKSLQKLIIKIEACHNKADSFINLWKLLDELTMEEGLKQSERKKHYIQQFENIPKKFLKWLSLSLERLTFINKVRTRILDNFGQKLLETIDHHEKEQKLKSSIIEEGETGELLLCLARLYFDSGDLVLAKPFVEKLLAGVPNSAEANFFQGVIAARQTEYAKADQCFAKAISCDKNFSDRINDFRQNLGDQYLEFANFFKNKDKNTQKRMLFKGLRYCPDHKKTIKQLQTMVQEDMEELKSALDNNSLEEKHSLINTWHDGLQNIPGLFSALSGAQQSCLEMYYGALLASRLEYGNALIIYQNALAKNAAIPDLHILMAESFFAKEDFDQGLTHLRKAVELDKKYAIHWENMGDDLMATGQHQEAVYAYEQCFTALPQKSNVLKKMGDCYIAMDQLDAAKEAYLQYKNLLAA